MLSAGRLLSALCGGDTAVASELGQMLHDAIHEAYVVEASGWAVDQVTRVANRLQADIDEGTRLRVEVLWMNEYRAFTAPGRYIYISRRLLEICRTDEAVSRPT